MENFSDVDENMDEMTNCFFEYVFTEMERNCLNARYKRRNLIDHLTTMIDGCVLREHRDPQEVCQSIVNSSVNFHEKHREENGSVCLMGKYHNILYVAMKLCYDWQLKDSATVKRLLDNIYICEKTFERLFVGGIFGTRAPFFIAGWKSDFTDQEENIKALVYFFDHASEVKLEYNQVGEIKPVRFIDIPIESCGNVPPVKIVLQLGYPDLLLILLRFGAVISEDGFTSGLDSLLQRLQEFRGIYPFNLVACLKIILRTVIRIRIYPEDILLIYDTNAERDTFLEKYANFVKDGLVPDSRCGICPPELKHLARCAVRYRLWQNYQLPNGIRSLPIPRTLHEYLDLLQD